jgi:hypothetical protein
MVENMIEEVRGIALRLGDYEVNTLCYVDQSERSEISKKIHAVREECVQALLMMNEIDNFDEEARNDLKRGIRSIKKKMIRILYPETIDDNWLIYRFDQRVD